MLNVVSRTWLIGGWLTALVLIVVGSMSMGARASTTMLLGALGVAPGIMVALFKGGTPSLSVAEILHGPDAKDGRPGEARP